MTGPAMTPTLHRAQRIPGAAGGTSYLLDGSAGQLLLADVERADVPERDPGVGEGAASWAWAAAAYAEHAPRLANPDARPWLICIPPEGCGRITLAEVGPQCTCQALRTLASDRTVARLLVDRGAVADRAPAPDPADPEQAELARLLDGILAHARLLRADAEPRATLRGLGRIRDLVLAANLRVGDAVRRGSGELARAGEAPAPAAFDESRPCSDCEGDAEGCEDCAVGERLDARGRGQETTPTTTATAPTTTATTPTTTATTTPAPAPAAPAAPVRAGQLGLAF